MGDDERARAGPGGGAVAGLGRVDERGLGRGDGRRPAPGAAAAEAVPDRGRRGGPAPGARAAVQPALPRRRAGRRPDAGARAACRPRPDARGREAGGAPRAEGLPRDGSRGWTAAGGPWPLRAQRRRLHRPPACTGPACTGPACTGPACGASGWASSCGPVAPSTAGSRVSHRGAIGSSPMATARPCTPLAFIDDATSAPMPMRSVPSESPFAGFEALEGHSKAHGRPAAFSHKTTVFRVAERDARSGHGMTEVSAARSPSGRSRSGGANSRPGPRAASRGPTAPCRTGS